MRIAKVALLMLLCTSDSVVCGDDDLTLKHSDWNVHIMATANSKKDGALPFDEELTFKKGILTTPYLQKQGFQPATYHSGGIETFLKWGCEQKNSKGEKITWEGVADRQKPGAWKLSGSIIRSFPDGRIYKYKFKGSGKPFPPDLL